jgi:hypothetical protein
MSAELERQIAEAQGRAEAYQEQIRRQKEQCADTTRTRRDLIRFANLL